MLNSNKIYQGFSSSIHQKDATIRKKMTRFMYLDADHHGYPRNVWCCYLPPDITYLCLRGTSKPHLNNLGKLDFWLRIQITSYKKVEPPTTRVQPTPINTPNALDYAYQYGSSIQQAIRKLTWIRLFFLLHTREYCSDRNDTTPHTFKFNNFNYSKCPTP